MSTASKVGPPPHVTSLRRHFEDLRDGTHGNRSTRRAKEALFAVAVDLLAPHAVRVLREIDTHLLLGRGDVTTTGLVDDLDEGPSATWALTWPEQRWAGVAPVTLHAFFGRTFHHPHLRGATNGEWPLNVYSDHDAAAEVPTLRAIAAGDLHDLVFQADYRIIPAVNRASP